MAFRCHFLPDPVAKCAARACPFADQREEAPEGRAAHGALKALAGLYGPIEHAREAGGEPWT
jgi:hypothetical protein